METSSGAWDVAVVGAGPAGSTAARRLAARGHRVVLLDRRDFPRDKVCGDALIPDALAAVERAGLLERVLARGRALDAMEAVSASGISLTLPVRCVTIRRFDLDALLLEGARETGAAFQPAEVQALEQDGGGVTLRTGSTTLRARAAVLATGATAALLPERPTAPMAVALRHYVRAPEGPEHLLVSFHRSVLPGYGWIFPMRDGWYNLGCGLFLEQGGARGANLRRVYERFVAGFPPARALLHRATDSTRLQGAPLRCGLRGADAASRGRVLAIGEAIGTTYSLTGEGIGKAMESGERAAGTIDRALAEDRFEPLLAFGRELRADLAPRYAGYAAGERWLARPWMSDLVACCGRLSPRIRRGLAGIVDETTDPARVVSPWGVVRALLPLPRL
jgi:geranylgeranyl reductase family protein